MVRRNNASFYTYCFIETQHIHQSTAQKTVQNAMKIQSTSWMRPTSARMPIHKPAQVL